MSGDAATSLAQRALAWLPVPAVLRPDVREVAILFAFGAVAAEGEGKVRVNHGRFVALVDSLAYLNAIGKDIEVRIAMNSRSFSGLDQYLQGNVWAQLWPYFRAVVPLVTPRAYFGALGELFDEEEGDLVLLRPIFVRIVLDTARTLLERQALAGQRYVHTGIKLATGPQAASIPALLGLGDEAGEPTG